jgi:hypothetical protein
MIVWMCWAIVASVPVRTNHISLSYSGVTTMVRQLTDAILIHQRDEVGLCQKIGLRRLALPEFAYRGLELLAFLEFRHNMSDPFIVGVNK